MSASRSRCRKNFYLLLVGLYQKQMFIGNCKPFTLHVEKKSNNQIRKVRGEAAVYTQIDSWPRMLCSNAHERQTEPAPGEMFCQWRPQTPPPTTTWHPPESGMMKYKWGTHRPEVTTWLSDLCSYSPIIPFWDVTRSARHSTMEEAAHAFTTVPQLFTLFNLLHIYFPHHMWSLKSIFFHGSWVY